MPATILVVDDDPHIVELNTLYLKKEGYRIISAVNGPTALDMALTQSPDLIVLDLMLPEMDGWDVCRRVRAASDVPIIMLTARDDDIDKIVGLELGADDYLTKPFNPRELVARVKAILRRAQPIDAKSDNEHVLTAGNIQIDLARHTATINSQPIDLRAKEFEILVVMAQNPDIVFSRDKLLEHVWGFDFFGETRTVDVHIASLRNKLGDASTARIETVWGIGYKLVIDA